MNEDFKVLNSTIIDVWTHGLIGVDIGKIIVALLILGLFGNFILSSSTKMDSQIRN